MGCGVGVMMTRGGLVRAPCMRSIHDVRSGANVGDAKIPSGDD